MDTTDHYDTIIRLENEVQRQWKWKIRFMMLALTFAAITLSFIFYSPNDKLKDQLTAAEQVIERQNALLEEAQGEINMAHVQLNDMLALLKAAADKLKAAGEALAECEANGTDPSPNYVAPVPKITEQTI